MIHVITPVRWRPHTRKVTGTVRFLKRRILRLGPTTRWANQLSRYVYQYPYTEFLLDEIATGSHVSIFAQCHPEFASGDVVLPVAPWSGTRAVTDLRGRRVSSTVSLLYPPCECAVPRWQALEAPRRGATRQRARGVRGVTDLDGLLAVRRLSTATTGRDRAASSPSSTPPSAH